MLYLKYTAKTIVVALFGGLIFTKYFENIIKVTIIEPHKIYSILIDSMGPVQEHSEGYLYNRDTNLPLYDARTGKIIYA